MPISCVYHLLQGLYCDQRICHIAKLLDFACIHTYGIICCLQKKFKKCTKCQLPIFGNIYCLYKIAQPDNNEKIDTINFTLVRLGALALSGYCLTHNTSQQNTAIVHGAICSCLYIMDEHLKCYGHSLFHITLGALYGSIFEITATEMLGLHPANKIVKSLE